jgi:hypothetical protein
MKRMLALSLAAFLFTGATLAAEEKTTPFYPLKVGSKWTYKVPGGTIEVKVEKKEKIGEEDTYKLETSSQGKISATENVVVKEDGVYRVMVNGLKPIEPIRFLLLPPEKGKSWTVKSNVSGQDIEGKFTIAEQDVTVQAFPIFKGATLVEGSSFKIAGEETSIKCWFVKDVGIVKLEFKLRGQEATLELEKYEPGK